MDITLDKLKIISESNGFNIRLMEKDYLLTYLLYLIKDVSGIYFKGGTALNKIFLNHARLSEDIDFTLTEGLSNVENEINERLKGTIFGKITHGKSVDKFVRLIVHYKLFHDEGTIFIDLNERGKLLCKPEMHKIQHFYEGYIPDFSVKTLSKEEMIAEKIAATIGRNRPRDHYDIYQIIKNKLSIDINLVKKKCEASGYEFNIIKMFNKADKLKSQWDEDMLALLSKPTSFIEIMQTLARHFKLKNEKDRLKKP